MAAFRFIAWVLVSIAVALLGADAISSLEHGEPVVRTTAEILGLFGMNAQGIVDASPGPVAKALSTLMNELGAEGWDYVRADILPSEERAGLASKQTVYHSLLVFRRQSPEEEHHGQDGSDGRIQHAHEHSMGHRAADVPGSAARRGPLARTGHVRTTRTGRCPGCCGETPRDVPRPSLPSNDDVSGTAGWSPQHEREHSGPPASLGGTIPRRERR